MRLLWLIAPALAAAQTLAPVTRQGRYMVTGGTRYTIRGVAYQPQGQIAAQTAQNQANGGFAEPDTFTDPLADATACNRDIPNLTRLAVNTIRVYSVNSSLDHSGCMNALTAAGIRVIIDLSLPGTGSINRASPSWDLSLLSQYTATIDAFSQYSNVLAYGVANEVVTSANNTNASAFIKAAARDIKAYLTGKGSSALVAYSSTDGDSWRTELADYLVCSSGANIQTIDIFGLNSYSGCGASSASAYTSLNSAFQTYPVVAYFSEFGCLQEPAGGRTWSEVPVIFGNTMLQIWSGGLAFEYFYDSQGLGLTANLTSQGAAITTNADFTALATRFNAVTLPTTIPATTGTVPTCAVDTNQESSNTLPPTPNAAVCNCLFQNADCQPNAAASNNVGALLNTACGLLGQAGQSCSAIASDGTTGTYGQFSGCAPIQKLAYAFSTFYDSQSKNAQACSFAGNATIQASAPAISAAASSCAASATASVFTVSSVSIATSATGARSSGTGAATLPSGTGIHTGAATFTASPALFFALCSSLFAAAIGVALTL